MSIVTIVTGSTYGIGHSTAARLINRGNTVLGLARSASPFPNHSSYNHFNIDLSDLAAVEDWFSSALPEYVPSDVTKISLINNAAGFSPENVDSVNMKDMEEFYKVNVISPTWLFYAFFRRFHGLDLRFINLQSGAAQIPIAGLNTYCATKAALMMSSKVFVEDIKQSEFIDSTAMINYYPGIVDTPMQQRGKNYDKIRKDLLESSVPASHVCRLVEAPKLPRYFEFDVNNFDHQMKGLSHEI